MSATETLKINLNPTGLNVPLGICRDCGGETGNRSNVCPTCWDAETYRPGDDIAWRVPEAPEIITLAGDEQLFERETPYGHAYHCWGCPICWTPEIAETEAMREGAI